MNETVKKLVDDKLDILKRRQQDLAARSVALQDDLSNVNRELVEIESEQADLAEFLAADSAK